jgi:L,D-peptidoglycan transpeptidase YkuD (ErfK/YbiS/YcfS/YnhG family)
MHIFIKNKKLILDKYRIKCAIGKRGIGNKKREGDKITPKGKFKIQTILYRKDRISPFRSKITKLPIAKNMGWCDDPKSKKYNKLIKLPFKGSAEKLYKEDNSYDIILVLNYNFNPIRKGKGSAIFIHVAKKNYKSTLGCIAVSKRNLKKIIRKINKSTIVNIS